MIVGRNARPIGQWIVGRSIRLSRRSVVFPDYGGYIFSLYFHRNAPTNVQYKPADLAACHSIRGKSAWKHVHFHGGERGGENWLLSAHQKFKSASIGRAHTCATCRSTCERSRMINERFLARGKKRKELAAIPALLVAITFKKEKWSNFRNNFLSPVCDQFEGWECNLKMCVTKIEFVETAEAESNSNSLVRFPQSAFHRVSRYRHLLRFIERQRYQHEFPKIHKASTEVMQFLRNCSKRVVRQKRRV